MKRDRFYDEISDIEEIIITKNYDASKNNYMRLETTFKYHLVLCNYLSVKKAFTILKKYNIKYFILGNGSNTLFVKKQYNEALIQFKFKESAYEDIVNCNNQINYLNGKWINKGIATFNFLSGVPATIGGAIYMNASANGRSIAEIIKFVYAFDLENMKYRAFNNTECQFAYRKSIFQSKSMIILGAKVETIKENPKTLLKEHHEFLESRKNKLPLEYPSLGSIFKNYNCYKSGALLDSLGVKGLKKGGAMVSYKHANVVVNVGNATGRDVLKLVRRLKKLVLKKYNINLEEEIIIH